MCRYTIFVFIVAFYLPCVCYGEIIRVGEHFYSVSHDGDDNEIILDLKDVNEDISFLAEIQNIIGDRLNEQPGMYLIGTVQGNYYLHRHLPTLHNNRQQRRAFASGNTFASGNNSAAAATGGRAAEQQLTIPQKIFVAGVFLVDRAGNFLDRKVSAGLRSLGLGPTVAGASSGSASWSGFSSIPTSPNPGSPVADVLQLFTPPPPRRNSQTIRIEGLTKTPDNIYAIPRQNTDNKLFSDVSGYFTVIQRKDF